MISCSTSSNNCLVSIRHPFAIHQIVWQEPFQDFAEPFNANMKPFEHLMKLLRNFPDLFNAKAYLIRKCSHPLNDNVYPFTKLSHPLNGKP